MLHDIEAEEFLVKAPRSREAFAGDRAMRQHHRLVERCDLIRERGIGHEASPSRPLFYSASEVAAIHTVERGELVGGLGQASIGLEILRAIEDRRARRQRS